MTDAASPKRPPAMPLRPAVGFTAHVLFDTAAPELDALAAWLTERLGDAATVTRRGDTLVVGIGGGAGEQQVVVRAVDAPVEAPLDAPVDAPVDAQVDASVEGTAESRSADAAAGAARRGPTQTVHPVFWRGGSAAVDHHRSHVELSTQGPDPRAARLALGYPLGSVAAVPGAVAVHDPAAGATWPAEVYADLLHTCLAQDLVPGALWASVWLDTAGAGRPVSGHTVGLAALGHPELVVEDSAAGAQPVYEVLSRLADAVAAGAVLQPGRDVPVGPWRAQVAHGPDPAGALRVAVEQ